MHFLTMKKVQPVFNIELSSSDSDSDPEAQIQKLKQSLTIPLKTSGHTQALDLTQVTDFVQSFKAKKSLNTTDYGLALKQAQ